MNTRFLAYLAGLSLLTSCGPSPEPPSASDHVELIDVGGRKLQLLTRGHGAPTVIIEAGMGEPGVESGSWRTVIDELSKTHRVCLYDRAGLGKSDPAPKLPRTSEDVAKDLHALLAKAKVPGPYLLVAHSYGGLHARMFSSLFPDQVVGLVLVDSTHPDQDERWLAVLPPANAAAPEGVRNARRFLTNRSDPASNPEQIDPQASSAQVRAARSLGNKPVVILTHSAGFRMDPNLPEPVALKLEQVSQQLQAELKAISSNSTLRQSANGGHNLQAEDPELVIQGIREALAAIPPPR